MDLLSVAEPNSAICYNNARQILSQPDIAEAKELADLPKLQKAAKEQARKWIDKIDPLMEQTLSDLIDYGNTVQGTYKTLSSKLIPQLENNDTAQKAHKEILQLLKQKLISPLQKKRETSENIARKVKEFHDKFELIYKEGFLSPSAQQVAASLGTVETVGDTLTEDESDEMRSKNADAKKAKRTANLAGKVACGACMTAVACGTVAVVGASTVGIMSTGAVGVAAAAAVAGIAASPAFPIVLVGVAILGGVVVIGGIAGIAIYCYTEHRKNKKNDELRQQYRDLHNYTQHVVESSAKCSKEWSARERDLKKIVAHLEEAERTPADATSLLESELETFIIGWKQVVDQCLVVRRVSQLSPQNLDEKVKKFVKQQKWTKQHEECQMKVLQNFVVSQLCQVGSFTEE